MRSTGATRRAYLVTAAGLLGGLAGCSSGSRPTPSATAPSDQPAGGGTPGPPSTAATPGEAELPTYGDGEVRLTVEVTVPPWTPAEDTVFFETDWFVADPATGAAGVPMAPLGGDRWGVGFLGPADQALPYRYTRNNLGYAAAEEFTPDSPDARRTVRIDRGPIQVSDTVGSWRWLDPEPPSATVPPYLPPHGPPRDRPFALGMGLLDFYTPVFDPLFGSTIDHIAAAGFRRVGFFYHPAGFERVEPLELSTDRAIRNTATLDTLADQLAYARSRGLEPMLTVGYASATSPNPGVVDRLREPQDDAWYDALATRWAADLVDVARFAADHGVEILAFSNQWPFWGDPTPDQRDRIDASVGAAIRSVQGAFPGPVTTDLLWLDPPYDFYGELDWLGDKWWYDLTDDRSPSVGQLADAARERIETTYRPIAEAHGKPVFLHHLAYASYDGAAGAEQLSTESPQVAESHPYDPRYPADFQEQVDAYEAVLRELATATYGPENAPLFVGAFSFSYAYWDSYDKSAGVRAKPAEAVWRKWNRYLAGG